LKRLTYPECLDLLPDDEADKMDGLGAIAWYQQRRQLTADDMLEVLRFMTGD
jgi:hypothetical protein